MEKFKNALSEDFCNSKLDPLRAQNLAYVDICSIINNEGRCITYFPSVPQVILNDQIPNNIPNSILIATGVQLYDQLNVEQKEIVDNILSCSNSVDYTRPRYFISMDQGIQVKLLFITQFTIYFVDRTKTFAQWHLQE